MRPAETFQSILSLPNGTLITDAAYDQSGHLWITTQNGVSVTTALGGASDLLTRDHGLLDNNVNTVLIDREQNIWLGTESGLSRLRPGPFSLFTVRDGLPNPFVRALARDSGGRLWVGTRDGVAVREHQTLRQVALGAVPDRRVYAFAALPHEAMLIGTRNGLVLYSTQGNRIYTTNDGLPDPFVTSLLDDGDGGVWIGTAQGLGRFEGGRIRGVTDPRLGTPFITSMARDRRGRLWIGLRSGGVIILDGTDLQRLGPMDGLSDQAVWALAEDETGGMWVGTNGDGAFRLDADGTITQFTAATRLINDFVWQVMPDRRGDVWLFTNQGLDRFAQGRFLHYGRADGLLVLEGSVGAATQEPNGSIWFGTGSGLLRYQPALDVSKPAGPRVYIDEVAAGSHLLATADGEVPAGTTALHIRFTSPALHDPLRTKFRHRLGPEDPWSEWSSERTVTFGRLPPSRYMFEVEVGTGHGDGPRAHASYAFTVLPFFWETWWFRALSLLGLAGAALLVPVFRNRHIERERRRLGQLVAEHTSTLAAQNAALEREVAERKAAEEALVAKDEQLRHAQRLEAVGRLAGGIAHDFNNLLTAIIGHTEFAQEEVPPHSAASADLAVVRQTAERASTLVGQLLTFSRQQMIKRRPLDLNVVAADAARMLHRVLGSDIVLQLDLTPEPAWVLADPGQLDQILFNLAVNARDAMPQGGRLIIRTARGCPQNQNEEASEEPFVALEVCDTGHGIDPSIRHRMFEPFFTTKEIGKGTGLGLATVYGIVTQNGGHITVDSEPGQGAHFRVLLPEVAAPAAVAVPRAGTKASATDATGQVILLVEDLETLRKMAATILRRKGYQVLEAANGPAALEVSANYAGPIHLLLSDMIMPGLNGRQVAEHLTGTRPETRVLFISGHADGVLGANGLIEGEHTQLLRKPFTPAELVARVVDVLGTTHPPARCA